MNRQKISKSVRFEILRRDNFACRYCGVAAPVAVLHIDHVIPVKHGGTNDLWNLTAACQECNLGKSDGVPIEDIARQVRLDQVTYQRSRGLPIYPCVYCSIPLLHDDDEEIPTQCERCNAAVCEAYETGLARGVRA